MEEDHVSGEVLEFPLGHNNLKYSLKHPFGSVEQSTDRNVLHSKASWDEEVNLQTILV